jgi:hypothetical protein
VLRPGFALRHLVVLGFVVALGLAPASAQRGRPDHGPREGSAAPDFTLRVLNGFEQVSLSEEVRERPVALLFGSYT